MIKESRGSVEAVGESNTNKLGVEGQKFSFEKDAPCKVYACNCSVKNRDIQKITGFISAALHEGDGLFKLVLFVPFIEWLHCSFACFCLLQCGKHLYNKM